tara:strand:+ start:246 stop:659 length:414 start_codon:yes stop_codon:yes gene_type:complete
MVGPVELGFLFMLILGIVLLPLIFFFVSMMKTLQACSPQNRTMEPGMVWLNLIPLFNLGWIFYTISCISNSLSNEFNERKIENNGQFGFGVGVAMAVCNIVSIIPVVGLFTSIASLVLWIIYWVQIVGFKNKIIQAG